MTTLLTTDLLVYYNGGLEVYRYYNGRQVVTLIYYSISNKITFMVLHFFKYVVIASFKSLLIYPPPPPPPPKKKKEE